LQREQIAAAPIDFSSDISTGFFDQNQNPYPYDTGTGIGTGKYGFLPVYGFSNKGKTPQFFLFLAQIDEKM
jgi:hypothetical protein